MVCRICGRKLKNEESIQRGYGPVCYGKIAPPTPRKKRALRKSSDTHGCSDDADYSIPGQISMEDYLRGTGGWA